MQLVWSSNWLNRKESQGGDWWKCREVRKIEEICFTVLSSSSYPLRLILFVLSSLSYPLCLICFNVLSSSSHHYSLIFIFISGKDKDSPYYPLRLILSPNFIWIYIWDGCFSSTWLGWMEVFLGGAIDNPATDKWTDGVGGVRRLFGKLAIWGKSFWYWAEEEKQTDGRYRVVWPKYSL